MEPVEVGALLDVQPSVVLLRRGDVRVLLHELARARREVPAEQGRELGRPPLVPLHHRHLLGAGVVLGPVRAVGGGRGQGVAHAHRQRIGPAGGDRPGVPGGGRVGRQLGGFQEAGRAGGRGPGGGRGGAQRGGGQGRQGGHGEPDGSGADGHRVPHSVVPWCGPRRADATRRAFPASSRTTRRRAGALSSASVTVSSRTSPPGGRRTGAAGSADRAGQPAAFSTRRRTCSSRRPRLLSRASSTSWRPGSWLSSKNDRCTVTSLAPLPTPATWSQPV